MNINFGSLIPVRGVFEVDKQGRIDRNRISHQPNIQELCSNMS